MELLGSLYGEIARRRRRWYDTHPAARVRLAHPVVSVGGLSVGGSGKTPVVAHLARLLIDAGERPAILSRGYAREDVVDGSVVVRDLDGLKAGLAQAGDEPLMLARSLNRVAVVVSPDRYLAGRLAEARLGCSMHLLDDGFQHLQLHRDVDLVVWDAEELDAARVLPFGRLREPMDVAARADALLVSSSRGESDRVAARFEHVRTFGVARALGAARSVEPASVAVELTAATRALAVAGIARPARFFADLKATGVNVVQALPFADHHRFSPRDIDTMATIVRASRLDVVLTTEKDLVRLLPLRPFPFSLAAMPLDTTIEPADEFRSWLLGRLAAARRERRGGAT